MLSWHLQGLDPATGELQTDPNIGFLPPDVNAPEGQGGVTFTVQSNPGLVTGEQISNGASIVFDRNEAIQTPTYTNGIDTTPPKSKIKSAKASKGSCKKLKVKFAGSDAGSGIAFRNVDVSRNGRGYKPWRCSDREEVGAVLGDRRPAPTPSAASPSTASATSELASRELWDAIVKSAKRKGDKLQLAFDKARRRSSRSSHSRSAPTASRRRARRRWPARSPSAA